MISRCSRKGHRNDSWKTSSFIFAASVCGCVDDLEVICEDVVTTWESLVFLFRSRWEIKWLSKWNSLPEECFFLLFCFRFHHLFRTRLFTFLSFLFVGGLFLRLYADLQGSAARRRSLRSASPRLVAVILWQWSPVYVVEPFGSLAHSPLVFSLKEFSNEAMKTPWLCLPPKHYEAFPLLKVVEVSDPAVVFYKHCIPPSPEKIFLFRRFFVLHKFL